MDRHLPTKNLFFILGICLIVIWLAGSFLNPAIAIEQEQSHNVLVIHSYHKGFYWTDQLHEGIMAQIGQHTNIEVYVEYMDVYRQPSKQHLALFAQLLKRKYESSQLSLIICTDNDALSFILDNQQLFPQIPVVFVGINDFNHQMLRGYTHFTGLVETPALGQTAALALRLHPQASQLIVYGADSVTYRAMKDTLLNQLKDNPIIEKLVFKESFSMEEAILSCSTLTPDTVVLIISPLWDFHGNFVSYEKVAESIARNCTVPLYSIADFILGTGVIGGKMQRGYDHGYIAAQMALRILSGEKAESIPIIEESPVSYMFDYDQLVLHSIDINSLPKDSIVINSPSNFYEIHRSYVYTMLGTLAFLVFALSYLGATNLKRQRAEKAATMAQLQLQQSYDELESTYQQLLATEEELHQQYDELSSHQERLRLTQERYQLALEGSNDIMWDWDMQRDDQIHFSARSSHILAFPNGLPSITSHHFLQLVHPEDVTSYSAILVKHLKKQIPIFQCQVRLRTVQGKGKYKWFLIRGKAVWDNENTAVRMAGSITDINDLKNYQEQIYQLAYLDSLTGLANRSNLLNTLEGMLDKATAPQDKVALFFMDLDNFKAINDSAGHQAGDELLQIVANMLTVLTMEHDMVVSRFGGDEFVLLKGPVESNQELFEIGDKILAGFKSPIEINGIDYFITPSMGLVFSPEHGMNSQTLLKNADIAMYQAKKAGGNRYQLFTERMTTSLLERVEMEKNLRYALQRQEFSLHYQPIVNMITGNTVGVEALLRWYQPERGWISPVEFIPVAEETGLIIPLGQWVLETAIAQNKKWQELGLPPLVMSVNISSKQLQQGNLPTNVPQALGNAGLDPRWLRLEITESTAIEDFEYTLEVLNELTEAGVAFALDDFGTGYSSLNYLRQLPVTSLKIDKSFLQSIMEDSLSQEIALAIITLAHGLNMTVVAEGVETRDQADFLRANKCDKAQGYLFSKSLPPEQLEEYLLRK